jgi:NTE family protein
MPVSSLKATSDVGANVARRKPPINSSRLATFWVPFTFLLLGGCATRPINSPITEFDSNKGYQIQARQPKFKDPDNLVVLAFSGGGTRAAAFSYGVLETLRRTEVTGPKGRIRLIDEVNVITAVSGGAFTALAYGLYGDKLFDTYEKQFLKRDVQGELIARFLNPANWPELQSPTWGRSELAAQLYDEILFNGATFADLDRRDGPLIAVSATDLSTGARLFFDQGFFDVICSDLDTVPLSRAAAASSAVPVILSPVTINNYGGTCNYQLPSWVLAFTNPATTPRPAARASQRLKELAAYNDSMHRPYLHLVDGGVADNVALRGVLDIIEGFEALHLLGQPTPLDHVRRIIIFVVNSHSSPTTTWDENENSPGSIQVLLKATGVPIERYSFETMELLRDTVARWNTFRRIRDSVAFSADRDPALKEVVNAPDIDLYAIDVSFPALEDKAEFDYLNNLPTSFVLSDAAVDHLRAAAGTVILESPDFQRLLKDVGATIVDPEPVGAHPAGSDPKQDLPVSGSSRP